MSRGRVLESDKKEKREMMLDLIFISIIYLLVGMGFQELREKYLLFVHVFVQPMLMTEQSVVYSYVI